jgi:hypothetical protein
VLVRSRRRAHRGGRSAEGKTHAIFARRQLEHGDNLSQRTFRLRQVTQLRSFGVGAGADMDDCFALFSGAKAEPSAPTLPGAENVTCDMLGSKNTPISMRTVRLYSIGEFMHLLVLIRPSKVDAAALATLLSALCRSSPSRLSLTTFVVNLSRAAGVHSGWLYLSLTVSWRLPGK